MNAKDDGTYCLVREHWLYTVHAQAYRHYIGTREWISTQEKPASRKPAEEPAPRPGI